MVECPNEKQIAARNQEVQFARAQGSRGRPAVQNQERPPLETGVDGAIAIGAHSARRAAIAILSAGAHGAAITTCAHGKAGAAGAIGAPGDEDEPARNHPRHG